MNIEAIIKRVEEEAENRRESAGYSGRMDDGGCQMMLDQIKFFRYGWSRTLPPEWAKHHQQIERESDPEYRDYVRLKNKFEK